MRTEIDYLAWLCLWRRAFSNNRTSSLRPLLPTLPATITRPSETTDLLVRPSEGPCATQSWRSKRHDHHHHKSASTTLTPDIYYPLPTPRLPLRSRKPEKKTLFPFSFLSGFCRSAPALVCDSFESKRPASLEGRHNSYWGEIYDGPISCRLLTSSAGNWPMPKTECRLPCGAGLRRPVLHVV